MKTNNESNENLKENRGHDVKKEKDVHSSDNSNYNKMPGSAQKGKGTGMSSEAGSNQTEKSWQGTGGSQADTANKNEHANAGNLNTDNIKNQSDQQRRASMGDGTPEMNEKKLQKDNIADEELNDVDWNNNKNK